MAAVAVTLSCACEQCGAVTVSSLRGPPRRFCSGACKQKAHRSREEPVGLLSRDGHCSAPECERRICAKGLCTKHYFRQRFGVPFVFQCAQCGANTENRKYCSHRCRGLASERKRTGFVPPTEQKACAECGAQFLPAENRHIFCSKDCGNKVRWRKSTALRRARLRAAVRVCFDPRAVFERDNWKCYICGCETPKSLRGSTDPFAPELDHIVPLAAGGEHTPGNTACACRRCNSTKGSKIRTPEGWAPAALRPARLRKGAEVPARDKALPPPKGVRPLYRPFDVSRHRATI